MKTLFLCFACWPHTVIMVNLLTSTVSLYNVYSSCAFVFYFQEHVYDGRLRKALKLDEGKKATDKNPDDEFL